jgi:hypothetical protein
MSGVAEGVTGVGVGVGVWHDMLQTASRMENTSPQTENTIFFVVD